MPNDVKFFDMELFELSGKALILDAASITEMFSWRSGKRTYCVLNPLYAKKL